MYTSMMLVALLGPGSTPTVSPVPVSQVIYRTASGQLVYIVPSPTIQSVSSTASSATASPVQPTTYILSNNNVVSTSYASPVVINASPVVRYSGPVYTTASQYQPAPVMSYAPVMMSSGAAAVCRT